MERQNTDVQVVYDLAAAGFSAGAGTEVFSRGRFASNMGPNPDTARDIDAA